jgi:hypothetical protein
MSWFNDFSFSLGIGAEVFILVAHKMTTSSKSRRILNPWEIPCVTILGILFCLIGSVGIILSIIELFQGRAKIYHYNKRQGGLKIENPLRSSSGDSKRNFLSNCPITIITF